MVFMSETSGDEIAFMTQARSGGGTGTSILVTLPKHIVRLFEVKQGDYLQLKFVKKMKKPEDQP